MTCRVPSSHGVTVNGVPLSRKNVTFVEWLKVAGYRTALICKSHLQNFTGASLTTRIPKARDGYFRAAGDLREAARHDLTTPSYNVEEPGFWSDPQPKVPTPFHGFDHVELFTDHGDHLGDHRLLFKGGGAIRADHPRTVALGRSVREEWGADRSDRTDPRHWNDDPRTGKDRTRLGHAGTRSLRR